MSIATAQRESAAPRHLQGGAEFDVEVDIIVVGGGASGLPAALFSRWLDNEVLLLEKAPELGGTANKAAFWYWVPNNERMQELGLRDDEASFLRYCARLAVPQAYDPDSPTLGMAQWEYDACRAIYESASPAVELLAERDALPYRHCEAVPDYWSELPEDAAPTGRVFVPRDARESMSDGGLNGIRTLSAAARRDGVDIRLGHRVQRLIMNGYAVVGVEASTAGSAGLRAFARKAVIFASGGFTHDVELRQNYLSAPVFGGCAAMTNEGDFVRIGSAVGAQLRNMNYAWMCPVPLEKAVARRPDMIGMFSVAGDSMLFVDKHGRRVVNEKLPYNELAQKFFEWDPVAGQYPYLVMIQIWDQRSQDHSASDEYGRLIVPEGADDSHVIRGATLPELTAAIGERLTRYAQVTGGLALGPEFDSNLEASIARFNVLARSGVDADFGRGERAVQQLFNGDVREEPGRANPTMWPLSDSGPYYAALVTGGTLDTKGGPKTSIDAQVLDDLNKPIPGLYGIGNCVASPSRRAYWAGGATIGPMIAFAYRAARTADQEPAKHASKQGVPA
ncbi:MAG: FAD-dependent oxidoreductase [Solirubrobacterales bacterium]|nr:FAD-dependent oxidoreductase [Solirubrobacterales bacterium]